MTFEVQLILLKPGNIQFLPRCTTLKLTSNIFLIILDDPGIELVTMQLEDWLIEIYFVMMPVVLTPSVLWVTKNLPSFLIGV